MKLGCSIAHLLAINWAALAEYSARYPYILHELWLHGACVGAICKRI